MAIASRNIQRAEKVAREFNIQKSYGCYEAVFYSIQNQNES